MTEPEPTPVTDDGEVIGLPPEPPAEDGGELPPEEPPVVEDAPVPTPGMVADGDE